MDIGMAVRVLLIPVVVVSLSRQIVRIYNDENVLTKYSRINYLVSGALAVVSIAANIPRPTSLWLRSICVVATHQSFLIYYLNCEQIIREEISNFLKRKLYIIVTLISVFIVVIEYFRRGNLGWFVDNDIYHPTFVYYASQILFYAVMLYVGICGIKIQYQSLLNSKPLVYLVRNTLGVLIFLLVLISAMIAEINLCLSIFYGDMYRYTLNEIYQGLKPLFGIVILLAAAPSPILARIFAPIKNYFIKRRYRQEAVLIGYLHEKLTRVVPIRRTLDQKEHSIRRIVEIGDARDILWSHTCHQDPITAMQEAQLLFSLGQKYTTIKGHGEYSTPVIQGDVTQHNLMVARYLRKLEQRRYGPIRAATRNSSAPRSPTSR
jgi:uncharacterized membrane protein